MKHGDAFKQMFGDGPVTVVKTAPGAPAAPASSDAGPEGAPGTPGPEGKLEPAPVIAPGINLPPPRPGGKDESISNLRKKAEDLEARLATAEKEKERVLQDAIKKHQEELDEREKRLAVFDYASTREFQTKFAGPLSEKEETAVNLAVVTKEDLDPEAVRAAIRRPLPEFKKFLDDNGVLVQDQLLSLWQTSAALRAQANAAVKSAPSRIKEVRERERQEQEQAAKLQEQRRKQSATEYALSLRDTMPGFQDAVGNPELSARVQHRRTAVAAVLSEAELSEPAREVVAKGVLFDDLLQEAERLRARVKELENQSQLRGAFRQPGLPTLGATSGASAGRTKLADSSREAHNRFLGNTA